MRHAVRLSVAMAVLVGAVALVAVAPATAQSDSLDLSISADNATAGEEITVTFTVENTGDEASGVILDITETPDDWSIESHEDDGGTWRQDGKWLFQTVESGDSVEPSVTMAVPENVSGEYTVAGNASTSETSTTAEATISVTDPSATEGSSAGGPGFGPVVALVALVAVALLARRRR